MLSIRRLWGFWIFVLSLLLNFLARPAHQNLQFLTVSEHTSSNVLLLTAHPDDECMFFAPTLLALREHHPTLHSLCLSVGNADGFGAVRQQELARSLDVLGVGEGRRWVIDNPNLQDNITAEWDPQLIADVLRPYVLEHHITTILTFDERGVSSHPNHVSLPRGASRLLSSLPAALDNPRPRLFTLVTVPLHEKYLGPVSPALTKAWMRLSTSWQDTSPASTDKGGNIAVVVSGWAGYVRALRAMREHWSQLVWFRWLYVSFSRYMWVNEWAELIPESRV